MPKRHSTTPLLASALAFALILVPRLAQAQDYTHKSFLIPQGGVALEGEPARPLLVDINLSENSAGRPVTIPLNAFWGVSDDVSIGVTHQRGLCFNRCDKVYNDAGFGMMVGLTHSPTFELDLHLGVPIHSVLDPFLIGTTAGVIGRANFSNVAFVFDPGIYVGLNRRNRGNGDGLYLPVWFYFQSTETIVPFVGTGATGPLNDFAGQFAVPLEGGMLFSVAHNVDIGFMLRFFNVLGHGGNLRGRDTGFLGRFVF
ncbi:MAG TPA: hypothetical protein VGI10_30125 [Polyangiaceae bacterium]